MAKTLDFNALKMPKFPLVMSDADRTNIVVTVPPEGLVEELAAAGPELKATIESGGKEGTQALYALAARLINCNLSGITVTADDLRDKYGLNIYSLLAFFNAYTDFIHEIQNAKN